MKNVVVAIALVFSFAAAAFADGPSNNTVGQNITVKANLTRALGMTVLNGGNATLDFGTLTLPASGAETTILPTSTKAVELQIVGNDNAGVTFNIPTTVSLANGSANLTFTPNVQGSQTTSNPGPISNPSLSENGNYYLFVGGALPSNIPTTQATGQYSGQFEITVNYSAD